MKIFIGHSFKDEDKNIVEKIKKFIQTLNFECITGEQSAILSVSRKVQERINQCDIFIGIFTKEKPLNHKFWEKSIPYTTSAWVIQESGYAIAQCKKVILLFEKPVITRLGLQADSEYLMFDRNKPLDELFTKLNEMLIGIQNNNNNLCSNITDTEINNIPINNNETTIIETITNQDNQNNQDKHELELIVNLHCSNDFEIIKQSYEELVSQENNEEEKIDYEATYLYRSEILGQNGSIEKLQKLSEQYPNNSYIKLKLADYYKKVQAYDKAALLYNNIANNNCEDIKIYANTIYNESKCIAINSNYEKGLQNIKNILIEKPENQYLYKSIALLAHDNKDWETFFNYAEFYLKCEPNDTEFRFKLAYAYSDQNKKKLSFYHYKILNDTSMSGTYYNNIGVLYDNFKLNVKSVNAYKKAIELDETLSISNLANLYINAGFIEDAKILLEKIEELKQKNITIHENIGNTKSRLKKAEQIETDKENDLFNEAKKQNSFIQEYAKKYCTSFNIDYEKLSGTWKTHKGEHIFEFKKDFECIFKINQKNDTEYTEFGIKGKITNLSFEASIKTREHNSSSYNNRNTLFEIFLGYIAGDKTYGIISEDYSTIKLCVIDEKDIANYYTWEKIK
ncbi:MAG: nucleotide-binding protein [bacterium]|nr:nucleotide-binding protein [bacterium]